MKLEDGRVVRCRHESSGAWVIYTHRGKVLAFEMPTEDEQMKFRTAAIDRAVFDPNDPAAAGFDSSGAYRCPTDEAAALARWAARTGRTLTP